jgi:serine/threonine-protein kinase
MIGREIGPYKILDKLGQGGMGIVYKGLHSQLDQLVAIKVLSPQYAHDPSMRERFIAEAKLQARLTHPHVVNIYNYLEDADNLFLIMEYINGPTLERRLAMEGRFPEQEAISTCQDVLAALSFMHAQAAIHRDIKPANIMFTATGMVKMVDFGIAKLVGEEGLTRAGMRIGTLWYMSPERIQGESASIASDLYALGVTLYQMATGKFPFKGDSEYSIMRGHLEAPPIPPWEVNSLTSQEFGQVILKSLEKNPRQRYQSAREFADALRRIDPQSNKPEVATQVRVPPASSNGRTRRFNLWQRAVLGAGLGFTLAMPAYFVWFYSPGDAILPFFRDLAARVVDLGTPTSATDTVVPPMLPAPLNSEPEEARPVFAPAVGRLPAEQEDSPAVREETRSPLPTEGSSAPSPTAPLPPAPNIESQDSTQDGPPEVVSTGKKRSKRQGLRTPQAVKTSPLEEKSETSGGWYIRR